MRRRDAIAFIFVASLLIGVPFALGGAPRWAICVAGLVSAAGAATFVTSSREMERLSPLLAFVAVAALVTLWQVIPLPSFVVAHLSPSKHQLVADNARALREATPSWMSLSLDPPATLLELAKLLGYVAFAYTVLRLATTPSRRQWLVSMVAVVGVAMAATTLVHLAFGAHRVFGLYRPKAAMIRPTLAPLLNQNHLSALMALAAPIAVGLAIAATGRLRVAWLGAAALCASVGLLAESRGGAIALVVGLVVVGVLALVQRRDEQQTKLRRSDMLAIAVTAMSGFVLLGVLTAGGVVRDLAGTRINEVGQTDSRFAAWRSSAEILGRFRLTGIGRGAFEMASTSVHDSSTSSFAFVENEYLQAVVDWGFVAAAVLALIFVWLATSAARRSRSSPWEAGAFAGLAALAIENATDFSLWMPGIAYPAIATLAALAWVPLSRHASHRWWRVPRVVVIGGVVAAVAVAASPYGTPARAETDAYDAWLAGKPAPRAAIARAAENFARHPADYVAAGQLAGALFAARDPRAVAVANRALSRHPTSGDLHQLTARMLLASQRQPQARVEYALALRYSRRAELLDEILSAFPNGTDVVEALPLEPAMVTEWASRLRQRGKSAIVAAYLEHYLALHPDDARVHRYAAETALDAGDVATAAVHAQRGYALERTAAATMTLARCLMRQDQPERARVLIEQQLDHPEDPVPQHERAELLVTLSEIQVAQGKLDAARDSLHTALGIADRAKLPEIHRRLADIEDRSGNPNQAALERERAGEPDR